MKNREKYAEEIKNYNGTNFCKDFIQPVVFNRDNCKYENGHIYAWSGSCTSWTAYNNGYVSDWPYAKLAEQEESDE